VGQVRRRAAVIKSPLIKSPLNHAYTLIISRGCRVRLDLHALHPSHPSHASHAWHDLRDLHDWPEWCSEDGSTTTSNASITEWFLNWYPQTQTEAVRPLECVQEAGELIFVPRGIPSRLLSACLALTAHLLYHSSPIATHTVWCTPRGVHSLARYLCLIRQGEGMKG